MRKYIGVVVVLALGVGLIALLNRDRLHGLDGTALFYVLPMLLIFVPFANPRLAAFIRVRPRTTTGVGAVLVMAGIAAPILAAGSTGAPFAQGPWLIVSVGIAVAGLVIAQMPRMLRSAARDEVGLARLRSTPAPNDRFSGVRQATATFRFLLTHGYAFLRIAGPWLILCCALGYEVGRATCLYAADKGGYRSEFLWSLLSFLAAYLVSLPLVATAWHRYVIESRRPRFGIALPDRAFFGYVWRCWLALTIVGGGERVAARAAASVSGLGGPHSAALVGSVANTLIWCLVLWIGSTVALVLPAVAIGDKTMTSAVSMAATRRLGAGYQLGLAITAGPFLAAIWALGQWSSVSGASSIWLVGGQIDAVVILVFCAVGAGAAYISQVYQAVRTDSPIALSAGQAAQ